MFSAQLSEVFREDIMTFMSKRICLVMEDLCPEFWTSKFEGYNRAVFEKSKAFENVVGFIDGTVIGI